MRSGTWTSQRPLLLVLPEPLSRQALPGPERPKRKSQDLAVHLDAAVQWLCRAQDAAGDGGVARSYSLVYNPYFKRKGWIPSYPETTGYIIPTLFDYARLARRQDIADRAVRMAEWECAVQMDSGRRAGRHHRPEADTGHLQHGPGDLRLAAGLPRRRATTAILRSAVRAGPVPGRAPEQGRGVAQEPFTFASSRMLFYTYNTRTAWALLLLSAVARDRRFRDAAVRNIEFSLRQQRENGWFESNCLRDPAQPLLHTIAYAIRGRARIGHPAATRSGTSVRARKAADAASRPAADATEAWRAASIEQWKPTVSWSCLTGRRADGGHLGQAVPGHRRGNATATAMVRANSYLRSVQLLETGIRTSYGGITGSAAAARGLRQLRDPELGSQVLCGQPHAGAGAARATDDGLPG